jgi:hypothetical protein
LRVVAQENFELEAKKLKHSRNAKSPSPVSAKTSIEDDLPTEAGPSSRLDSEDNSEFEEFFDIGFYTPPLSTSKVIIIPQQKFNSLSLFTSTSR